MWSPDATFKGCGRDAGRDRACPVALTAVATLLHLAILAGRVPGCPIFRRQGTLLARQAFEPLPPQHRTAERVPAHPTYHFAAGELRLSAGIAVVTFALWLHIMRLNGAHGP